MMTTERQSSTPMYPLKSQQTPTIPNNYMAGQDSVPVYPPAPGYPPTPGYPPQPPAQAPGTYENENENAETAKLVT